MPPILNFHGIGAPVRPYEDGEESVWISKAQFIFILDQIEHSSREIGVTFDDGNASDFYFAVPELRARSIKAKFFVVVDRIDQEGFLTTEQIKQIDSDPLFSIGSHGMRHKPWRHMVDAEIDFELNESRDVLSRICGRPITEAGLPFGQYNRKVLSKLVESGYTKVFSSDGVERLRINNPIPRLSVRNSRSPVSLPLLSTRTGLIRKTVSEIKTSLKSLI